MMRVNQVLLLCLFLGVLSALKTPSHEAAVENVNISSQVYINQELPAQTFINVVFSYLNFVNTVADTQTYIDTKFQRIKSVGASFKADISNCEFDYFTAIDTIYNVKQKNFVQNHILYDGLNFTKKSKHIDGTYDNLNSVDTRWPRNIFENIVFTNADFIRTSFYGATFKNVSFIDCNFYKVGFGKATFKNVYMNRSNYNQVSFKAATIENSNFENAQLIKVKFRRTKFINSTINGEDKNENSATPASLIDEDFTLNDETEDEE